MATSLVVLVHELERDEPRWRLEGVIVLIRDLSTVSINIVGALLILCYHSSSLSASDGPWITFGPSQPP